MITTREARLAAEAWMREEAGRHPELVGAILAGSTRTRDPEEPHPPSSDVDLFIYVDAGHHREALLHLLLVRTAVQGIIENDGGEEARASSRIGYRRLLTALGIDGDEALQARGQALRAFMPALREDCDALLARAPGLLD